MRFKETDFSPIKDYEDKIRATLRHYSICDTKIWLHGSMRNIILFTGLHPLTRFEISRLGLVEKFSIIHPINQVEETLQCLRKNSWIAHLRGLTTCIIKNPEISKEQLATKYCTRHGNCLSIQRSVARTRITCQKGKMKKEINQLPLIPIY